jgi:hypothetical protein
MDSSAGFDGCAHFRRERLAPNIRDMDCLDAARPSFGPALDDPENRFLA